MNKRVEKVTITEVAKLAGVSTATAGRVLGQYGYTSEENKSKVKQAAETLGYRPNLLARGLITGRTKTIGVVAGDIQSPFYASIVRGIADVARAAGFGILLTNSDELLEREVEAVQLLMEKRIDGLIVAPCDVTGSKHLHEVKMAGCPIVFIDRYVLGLDGDSVTLDNREMARRCVEELIKAGHRRIGLIAELEEWKFGDMNTLIDRMTAGEMEVAALFPSWQRLQGYIEAHLAAGLPIDRTLIGRAGDYSQRSAQLRTFELLSSSHRPSALFTVDGLMSAGAMMAITNLGLSIPDDLSIVCFDDLDWMQFMRPGLTAVTQPLTEMGATAARLMLERIAGDDSAEKHLRLQPSLTMRGSIAVPS